MNETLKPGQEHADWKAPRTGEMKTPTSKQEVGRYGVSTDDLRMPVTIGGKAETLYTLAQDSKELGKDLYFKLHPTETIGGAHLNNRVMTDGRIHLTLGTTLKEGSAIGTNTGLINPKLRSDVRSVIDQLKEKDIDWAKQNLVKNPNDQKAKVHLAQTNAFIEGYGDMASDSGNYREAFKAWKIVDTFDDIKTKTLEDHFNHPNADAGEKKRILDALRENNIPLNKFYFKQ